MPTPLPVPSKGALRALRKLALGTSCTIAFGAGLLTEDRRRRIHSAREIHENAKRLKSSRKYHSAGTTSLETLEDQNVPYRDAAFWLPSNVMKSTATAIFNSSATTNGPRIEAPIEEERSSRPSDVPKYKLSQPKIVKIPSWNASRRRLASRAPDVVGRSERVSQNRQNSIATDVTRCLQQHPSDVDGAAAVFFDGLDEASHVDKSSLSEVLVDAAIRLSKACWQGSMFASSSKILDIVLSHGQISEEQFLAFKPHAIIRSLVFNKGRGGFSSVNPENLKKACSIFLTTLKEKPTSMSPEMRLVGFDLCRATCEQGMFDLTLAIFARLESRRAGKPLMAVDYLIKATHGKGYHKKISRHFLRLYTQTSPNQTQFYQVTGLVIDSVLILGKLDQAEEVLTAASSMAEAGGIRMSTTWFLRVLGEEYRTHRDLDRLEALFKRLRPLSLLAPHSQALYGPMIQSCIESRQEDLAWSYYNELRQTNAPCPEDLRIYGHFALAKAYRGDWHGVKEDFHKMKQDMPEQDEVYSIIFTPILKEFTKFHTVDEMEDFIQYFLVTFHLKLTSTVMNAMIDVYSKAHEVDAISRWIDYAAADGYAVDSKTFNTVLRNCALHFQFTFKECYRLYCLVRTFGPDLVNNDSLSILRNIAMKRSPNESIRDYRLQILKRLDDPVQVSGGNEIYRAMTTTFAQSNNVAVLKIYRRAERDHVRLDTTHLTLAVRASLRLHGVNAEAARLIRDAEANGITDVTSAIACVFVHQMSDLCQSDSRVELFNELTDRTIASFEDCGMKVPQKVITHAASVFLSRGEFRMAINLWDSMSKRLKIPSSSFDLASLTTLLKAYMELRDGDGVRWVIEVLLANNLSPDVRLKAALKEARRQVSRKLDQHPHSARLHEWWTVLDDAHHEVVGMRQQAKLIKEEVKVKVIKIMETAIHDQAPNAGESQERVQEGFRGEGQKVCQAEDDWRDLDMGSPRGARRISAAMGG